MRMRENEVYLIEVMAKREPPKPTSCALWWLLWLLPRWNSDSPAYENLRGPSQRRPHDGQARRNGPSELLAHAVLTSSPMLRHLPRGRDRHGSVLEPVVAPVGLVQGRHGHLLEDVGLGELGVKVGDRLVRVDKRLERRGDLARFEGDPVDRFEERVLFELFGVALRAEPVSRIPVQKLRAHRISLCSSANNQT